MPRDAGIDGPLNALLPERLSERLVLALARGVARGDVPSLDVRLDLHRSHLPVGSPLAGSRGETISWPALMCVLTCMSVTVTEAARAT
jgi:hypothetical protein